MRLSIYAPNWPVQDGTGIDSLRCEHETTINYFLRSLNRLCRRKTESNVPFRFCTSHSMRPRPPARFAMTLQSCYSNTYLTPSDFKRYYPFKLHATPECDRSDIPIRAQSVCLKERPRSQYGRSVKSADLADNAKVQKQFYPCRPKSSDDNKRNVSYRKSNQIIIKSQNRKLQTNKIPCSVSVQTLSIPMKYADESGNQKYSTSARHRSPLCYVERKDNPLSLPKQGSVNKKLCQADARGKETENKLLLQISEAEQVADFERILNSNAILSERARGHVWCARGARHPPSTAEVRPRSSYSLRAVSDAYHYLYQRHHESLQPLIEKYRRGFDQSNNYQDAPQSILGRNWYDELQDLSEFYDEDKTLQKEIEVITDQIITDEVKATEQSDSANKNFNLNLASLISLHVTGDSVVPLSDRDESRPPSDIDHNCNDHQTNDGKEWLAPIMSSNSDESRQNSQEANDGNVDNLAQSLSSVIIQDNASVPTITLSNCCDNCSRSNLPNNTSLTIHLTVPSIQSIDESRPPIM